MRRIGNDFVDIFEKVFNMASDPITVVSGLLFRAICVEIAAAMHFKP